MAKTESITYGTPKAIVQDALLALLISDQYEQYGFGAALAFFNVVREFAERYPRSAGDAGITEAHKKQHALACELNELWEGLHAPAGAIRLVIFSIIAHLWSTMYGETAGIKFRQACDAWALQYTDRGPPGGTVN